MLSDESTGVVENFSLSKTKAAYLVKYGIAPWVNELLQDQMDVQIRFWSDSLNKSVTRYQGSEFQYNTDALTLKETLLKSLELLPIEKQTQLAMDGPHNWKILDLLSVFRDEEEYPKLENIGSCGLHVISGALHTGVGAAGFKVCYNNVQIFETFTCTKSRIFAFV